MGLSSGTPQDEAAAAMLQQPPELMVLERCLRFFLDGSTDYDPRLSEATLLEGKPHALEILLCTLRLI